MLGSVAFGSGDLDFRFEGVLGRSWGVAVKGGGVVRAFAARMLSAVSLQAWTRTSKRQIKLNLEAS